jgi:hypothetical protein
MSGRQQASPVQPERQNGAEPNSWRAAFACSGLSQVDHGASQGARAPSLQFGHDAIRELEAARGNRGRQSLREL